MRNVATENASPFCPPSAGNSVYSCPEMSRWLCGFNAQRFIRCGHTCRVLPTSDLTSHKTPKNHCHRQPPCHMKDGSFAVFMFDSPLSPVGDAPSDLLMKRSIADELL